MSSATMNADTLRELTSDNGRNRGTGGNSGDSEGAGRPEKADD